MSAEASGWVWKHSPYRGAELLVHLAIADVVNDLHENRFWMSTATLATKAKVSRSTVTAALSHMVQHGWLEMIESGADTRTPSVYRFVTSAISVVSLDRPPRAIPKEITQEPKGASAISGHARCVRCGGRGTLWNAAGGFEIPCPEPIRDETGSKSPRKDATLPG